MRTVSGVEVTEVPKRHKKIVTASNIFKRGPSEISAGPKVNKQPYGRTEAEVSLIGIRTLVIKKNLLRTIKLPWRKRG